MTGHDLRQARQNAGWTQAGAARRLDLTQAYLSMVENGQRVISAKLEKKALAVMAFPATALPLQDLIHPVRRDFQRALGALGRKHAHAFALKNFGQRRLVAGLVVHDQHRDLIAGRRGLLRNRGAAAFLVLRGQRVTHSANLTEA